MGIIICAYSQIFWNQFNRMQLHTSILHGKRSKVRSTNGGRVYLNVLLWWLEGVSIGR